jgi:hypothetical protein
MSGKHMRRAYVLFLPVLALAVTAAHADPTARYGLGGATGAAMWGLGDQLGTEAVLFAFSQAAPAAADSPAAGPRIAFSVTRWQWDDKGWVRRQWYGDSTFPLEALAINPDLGEGTLDVTLMGSLEERSAAGVSVRRDVPGHVQVRWVANGSRAGMTTSYIYQTPPYNTTLQTAGEGRGATTEASVTVEALGEPIHLWGFGSLSAVTSGTMDVTLQ